MCLMGFWFMGLNFLFLCHLWNAPALKHNQYYSHDKFHLWLSDFLSGLAQLFGIPVLGLKYK